MSSSPNGCCGWCGPSDDPALGPGLGRAVTRGEFFRGTDWAQADQDSSGQRLRAQPIAGLAQKWEPHRHQRLRAAVGQAALSDEVALLPARQRALLGRLLRRSVRSPRRVKPSVTPAQALHELATAMRRLSAARAIRDEQSIHPQR